MSVRLMYVAAAALSLGIICSAQVGVPLNSSRSGSTTNSVGNALDGAVSGTVRSADDHPMADVRIEVRAAGGELVITGYSDTAGTFRINQIPPGSYEVVAIQGINDARERVQVAGMETNVNLQIQVQTAAPDGSTSVSVAQFKVPDRARKLYQKGNEALQKNKLDEAKKYAEKALEIYPSFAEALTLRGILRLNDGSTDAGIADFDAAIKADPNYALAYTTLGAALNQMQKFGDATKTLLRAVSIQPRSWQAYYELAKASLGQGDYKNALKNVSKACEISQEYAPVHLVKAHALLGLKMYQDAVGELELYLTQDPSSKAADSARRTLTMAKSFANDQSK